MIWGIAAAILIAAATVGWGLSQSAQYQGKADYEASEHARYTSDKVAKTCVGIATAQKITCLGDAIDTQRAYERDEQDLVAQRQSALWGYIMAIAAVIGMILSVVGVFLVWTTFRETKDANVIAERSDRAWVIVQDFNVTFISDEAGVILVGISYVLKNVGSSPAFAIFPNYGGTAIRFSLDKLRGMADEFVVKHRDKQSRVNAGYFVAPGETHRV